MAATAVAVTTAVVTMVEATTVVGITAAGTMAVVITAVITAAAIMVEIITAAAITAAIIMMDTTARTGAAILGHWGGHSHGRYWHGGRWWSGYGVGPCWQWTPAGYVWVCN